LVLTYTYVVMTKLRSLLEKEIPWVRSFIQELVDQNSWTFNIDGVNKAQDIIMREALALKMKVNRISMQERADIMWCSSGKYRPNQPYLLIACHSDTVHRLDSDFSQFFVHENRWYGPGILDMKASIGMVLLVLRVLHSLNKLHSIPLRLLINSSQELPTPQIHGYLAAAGYGASAILVCGFGRKGDHLITMRSGLLTFRLQVWGKASHVGNDFQSGTSAIDRLARLIGKINKLTNLEKGLFANVGSIAGGDATSIVAEYAEATFEIRIPTLKAALEIRSKLRLLEYDDHENIVVHIEELGCTPPLEQTPLSRELFKSYHSYASQAGLAYAMNDRVGGTSDANRLAPVEVPILDGLGPSGWGAHTREEFINPDSIVSKALNMLLFICGQP
jgi:glutamate carboxypeptidase